jgi:hypothetical protein
MRRPSLKFGTHSTRPLIDGSVGAAPGCHVCDGTLAHGSPSELSESAQIYLLTLRSMAGAGIPAMTAALARRMHVSTQAASEMVARLGHDGLIDIAADRSLQLSKPGQEAADTIFLGGVG